MNGDLHLGASRFITSLVDAAKLSITRPNHGLLGTHIASIPVIAYNMPSIKAKYPQSFSDGKAIYIEQSFAEFLVYEEIESGGAYKGLVPLILMHEMRILMSHANRLTAFPDVFAHVGGEISAFCKLRLGFEDMEFSPSLLNTMPECDSLTKEQIYQYSAMAEEKICRIIQREHSWESPDARPGRPNVCRDPQFIYKAIAEHEEQELLSITNPTNNNNKRSSL